MKLKNIISGLILLNVVCFSTFINANDGDTVDRIIKDGVLKAGICLAGPPMGFRDQDNNPAGLDVEIAQSLANELGVKLEIVEVIGSSRIPSLVTNKVDVIACNFTPTMERAKSISFSLPYIRTGIKIITKKDSTIQNITDLNGKTVAVGRGTTNEALVKENAPEAKLAYYDEFTNAFLALTENKVDAALEDSSMVEYLATLRDDVKVLPEAYTSDPISLGARRDDAHFIRYLDLFVSTYISSGKLAENYKKFWGSEYTQPMVTPW